MIEIKAARSCAGMLNVGVEIRIVFKREFHNSVVLNAEPRAVFVLLDDHARLAAHMTKSSWMMGGGKMVLATDDGQGRRVGSHIRLAGTAFGIFLSIDEVVTEYEPPRLKRWETVGEPPILVIGSYAMNFVIEPIVAGSRLTVQIDYSLPTSMAWLGQVFGRLYARWCVNRRLRDAKGHFAV